MGRQTAGGKYAWNPGRNNIQLEMVGFEALLRQLKKADKDVKKAVDRALEQAGETILEDTIDALAPGNLPARGRYSTGDTERSVARDTKPQWANDVATLPVGFDFKKPGAGGWLITGTPRMQPVAQLNKMYKKKKYFSDINKDIENVLWDFINGNLQ